MENTTMVTPLKQPIVFELEGFYIPPGYGSFLFFLALFNYIVVLMGNGVVVCVIVIDKNLHRPMFVMICHLVVCDLLGATAVLPRLMMHFLTGERRIAYIPAITQAFSVHTYGVAAQTLLGAMAYDRYHTIMTSARLHSCCALAWFVALLCIAVLFAFHMNAPLCGNIIQHVYCSNRAILRLACRSTLTNNIYGLSMFWSVSTGIFLIIGFSYFRILQASVKQGKVDSGIRSKAFQTCASHLVVYVLYEIASVIIIVSQRFPSVSQDIKKFFSILFIIIPPAINPIIYGLQVRAKKRSAGTDGEKAITFTREEARPLSSKRKKPNLLQTARSWDMRMALTSLFCSSRLMENHTYNSLILQLEGLNVSEESIYPLFLFLFFSYLFIMVANISILSVIFIDKNLHQPMYLLFCNLSVSDMIGSTRLMPRLLIDMLQPPSERLISYYECVVQAFTTHMFGTTTHTVLMIMAFDRYVAICNPLRYATIMTNKMVIKLTVSAWGAAFVLVGILIGLTIRLNRCRIMIMNPYCDNASLFKLSCESVFINNVYGLTFTVVLLTVSIGSIVLTYAKITVVCLTSKNKSLNSKALKTCSTHLIVYLIMLVSGMISIALHRFPQYSYYRKLSAILFVIVPGSLNPIIYGIQSKEIRKFLSEMFQSKKCLP
ncbi:uncharacterized protein [Trachinotus anak]|uniref:uncharacterized protein n=1 Tax=Trachinotus anak TaxID=443729 RepID=UPI0039F1EC7D